MAMKRPAVQVTTPNVDARHGPDLAALPVSALLQGIYDRYKNHLIGKLADYIPELAKVEPNKFGISIVTADGFVYGVGDADFEFSVQSISKPIVYGLALADQGRERVLRKIGVEPSGDPFNSITFDDKNNRPFNPMVNAGAIVSTSLVKGAGSAERFQRILKTFERFTGRALRVDDNIHKSESATGHRNRAIAYLELNSGMIEGNVEEHLELYFRQCAILVTARDLAVMAATLANGGINTLTGERALPAEHVRDVLSVMNTCGMYDYAGGWQFSIGLPAKSGVGGGIMAVLPGRLGIGVFSPLLDAVGNSERGVKVCEDISRYCRVHLLDYRAGNQTAIRRIYRGNEVRSKRVRRDGDSRALDEIGNQIVVYELQGDLAFPEAEAVTRRVMQDAESGVFFVLDFERLFRVDSVALKLIRDLGVFLKTQNKELVISGYKFGLSLGVDLLLPADLNADGALERLEDIVLMRAGYGVGEEVEPVGIPDLDIVSGFSKEQIAKLSKFLPAKQFKKGECIVHQGDAADSLFFITRGRVDVRVPIKGRTESHRVSTIEAGKAFGELALFNGGPRTADVLAASDVEVLVLDKTDFEAFGKSEPEIYRALMIAVGKSLADRLRRANQEIRVLAQ
jgi:glutaminase